MYVPPIAIFDNMRRRLAFFNGAFATQRASSIILIICIHKGLAEEGRILRKCCAASMRLLHSSILIFRSLRLLACL
jgi:hypothetical protein